MTKLNSIDDIDDMLDEQYSSLTTEESDETEEEELEVEVPETDVNISDDTDEDETDTEDEQPETDSKESESVQEPKTESKPTKEDKKAYSFNELRQERDNYKKQSEKFEGDNVFLKELANSYGYTDVEKFKSDLRAAQIAKEAQTKGIDPTIYKEIVDSRNRIAELEAQNREKELDFKAEKFNGEVDSIVKELNLGDNGAEIVFQRLAESGYTNIDQILDLPNVKPLLRGLLSDYVKTSAEQKQIKAIEKAQSLSDNPGNDTGTKTSVSLDDIIAEEMKQYKADNFL